MSFFNELLLIYTCLKNNDTVDEDDIYKEITKQLSWVEEERLKFAEENAIIFDNIIGFIKYLEKYQGYRNHSSLISFIKNRDLN